jgi:hypothetical protein
LESLNALEMPTPVGQASTVVRKTLGHLADNQAKVVRKLDQVPDTAHEDTLPSDCAEGLGELLIDAARGASGMTLSGAQDMIAILSSVV